ncbi:unnamed protein product [Lota lota]
MDRAGYGGYARPRKRHAREHEGFAHKTCAYHKRHEGNLYAKPLAKRSLTRIDTGTVEVTAFTMTDKGTTRESAPGVPVESHTEENLPEDHSDVLLSTTRSTMHRKVKTCGAFSCIGIACYKHMNATEICQEDMSYSLEVHDSGHLEPVCERVDGGLWTAGCAHRCGPRESCSPFSGYRCQQECCKARPASCLRLDGSIGAATGSCSHVPLMPALMCITSQLMGLLLA